MPGGRVVSLTTNGGDCVVSTAVVVVVLVVVDVVSDVVVIVVAAVVEPDVDFVTFGAGLGNEHVYVYRTSSPQ